MILAVNKVYNSLLSIIISQFLSKKELDTRIKVSGLRCVPMKGEKLWKKRWESLSKRINKDYYRFFSQYIGESQDIVPDDICHNVIETILNPHAFRGAVDDKNIFDILMAARFKAPVTPVTLMRSIDGSLMDGAYNIISDVDDYLKGLLQDRIIAKPTFDSSSGQGVMLFERNKNGKYEDKNNHLPLTCDVLIMNVGRNYVLQECLEQSDFMSDFCSTAVNTIRVATYRSVETNEVHVLNSIMRIANNGSYVDNAHAGGCFIGVYKDGSLGKYLCNQYGEKITIFNGIDFEHTDFKVPNIEEVWNFSKKVASCVPHMRLLQLDVAIDKEGTPRLIEYNLRAFSPWLYQFTTGPAFGQFTEEIVEYCKKHRKEANRVVVSF